MEKTYKITLPKGVSVNEIETSVEDGVLSVSVEMARENYLPNDGDFVTCGNGYRSWVIIFKESDNDPYSHCDYYALHNIGLEGAAYDSYCNSQDTLRPATEEERRELLDALAKEGKRWNAEKKRIEDLPRWRAKKRRAYYYIIQDRMVAYKEEAHEALDNHNYELGNYFRTREAAEKAAKQIREIFKNSKAG